ncbi:hypothetical protein U3516DRAFT_889211, partial [Neocallimastix sp. 'constans']
MKSLHNHLEKEFDSSLSIAKHKIKIEIRKNLIPLGMGIKPKRIFDEVSQEMVFIYPEYNAIKSQITKNIYKNYLL